MFTLIFYSLSCPIVILGAGIGGAHSAYRLSSIFNTKICIFDRNNYVGGRIYDLDCNGNVPEAYSNTSISAQGAQRFFPGQAVIKQLADELNISYSLYKYQTSLIKARGKFFTSINQMCSTSYTNLTCTNDANGLNANAQLWKKLLDEYLRNSSNLYNFADFSSFSRAMIGDEATNFLRDSDISRTAYGNINVYSLMESMYEELNLTGPLYYPHQGMSQLAKRMMYIAVQFNHAQLFLNEEVLSINERNTDIFTIETTRYNISTKQLIAAIDPLGWQNIKGSIGRDIQSNIHFQSILPIKVVTIQCYWPRQWWEESSMFGRNIDRAWTTQNCISYLQIISQRPEQRHQNLTRTVYDDGLCVEMWSSLIARSSQDNLIEEILRGLQSIFIDVQIPRPTKVFTQIWPAAWYAQKSNSKLTNKQIMSWAVRPLKRLSKHQFSLVSDGFNIDRTGWTEGAVKSSLISLVSQFDLKFNCVENDASSGGKFCASEYI